MKVFQIKNGLCFYDMTPLYDSAEQARHRYPPSLLIVDTPDYVFENWGYDDTKEGDERFIKPTPPEGWAYSDQYGCFYDPSRGEPDMASPEESIEALKAQIAAQTAIQSEMDALIIDQAYRLSLLEMGGCR